MGRTLRLTAVAFGLAAFTAVAVPATAATATPGSRVAPASGTGLAAAPLSQSGRWITDASGRVVVLHGLNEVYKVAP
jgi:endoglycosylceramidase